MSLCAKQGFLIQPLGHGETSTLSLAQSVFCVFQSVTAIEGLTLFLHTISQLRCGQAQKLLLAGRQGGVRKAKNRRATFSGKTGVGHVLFFVLILFMGWSVATIKFYLSKQEGGED